MQTNFYTTVNAQGANKFSTFFQKAAYVVNWISETMVRSFIVANSLLLITLVCLLVLNAIN